VTIEEITGDQRDRIYAEQASRYPGFAEYEQKTAGVRTIPVLALLRDPDKLVRTRDRCEHSNAKARPGSPDRADHRSVRTCHDG
jgi:hypothetical protein